MKDLKEKLKVIIQDVDTEDVLQELYYNFENIEVEKIYDLDEEPVDVKRWTELPNVRAYYDFFQEHKGEF